MSEREGVIKGVLEYSTDLFDTPEMQRFVQHFQTLLASIVKMPEVAITKLPILTEQEKQLLLQAANSTLSAPKQADCVHSLFAAQVNRTPDAIAIVSPGSDWLQLSYRELDRRADRLALSLRQLGVEPDTLVGICVERSPATIAAILGILKAGGGYLPLDLSYPQSRLEAMVAEAKPQIIVTSTDSSDTLSTVLPALDIPVLCLESNGKISTQPVSQSIATDALPQETRDVCSDDLAYVIYTSGSTGRPKGVMVEHRALVNFTTAAIEEYKISAGDRVLQFASISFDAAVEEIFPTLCSGATLVLRTEEMISSASHFMQQCRDWRITVLDLPTAYWHLLSAALAAQPCPIPTALRLVIIGGEAALPDRLADWQRWLRNSATDRQSLPVIANTYGPTEATVVTTCQHIYTPPLDRSDSSLSMSNPDANLQTNSAYSTTLRSLPIGRSLPNSQIYLLDDCLQPVPTGIAGQIYVGGHSLARGYLNRESLTQESFIPNPFVEDPTARLYPTGDLAYYLPDGSLQFLGRRDNQVKIRGFRIEPSEIEAALGQHPAVKQCTVVAQTHRSSNSQLVAYVVTRQSVSADLDRSELHRFLQQRMPAYMVPTAFVQLSTLPLTPSNKVDRKALPSPEDTDLCRFQSYVPARNPQEQQLVEIWAEVLDVDRVGIYDNFFEIGGHSLLAVQTIARCQDIYGDRLPLGLLFEFPTIAELVQQLNQSKSQPSSSITSNRSKTTTAIASSSEDAPSLVLLQSGLDTEPPLFLIHDADGDISLYGHLAAWLNRHATNIGKASRNIYGIKPHSVAGKPILYNRMEAIAADYCQQIQSVWPRGPYLIGGLCVGGRLAFETASQLEAQGKVVALVTLLDAAPTGGPIIANYRTKHIRAIARSQSISAAISTYKTQKAGPLKTANTLIQIWRDEFNYNKRDILPTLMLRIQRGLPQ